MPENKIKHKERWQNHEQVGGKEEQELRGRDKQGVFSLHMVSRLWLQLRTLGKRYKKWMSRFHTLASEDFSRMQHGHQDVLNSSGDLVYKAENHSMDGGGFYQAEELSIDETRKSSGGGELERWFRG